MKIKIDPADKLFALFIKWRDKWTCQRCKKIYDPNEKGAGNSLQNSHFWSRRHEGTRFDPQNCDSLCYGCHALVEGDKQGWYREFKIQQLGIEGYKKLEWRARGYCKKDRKLSLLYVKQLIQDAKMSIK